jgi:pSer/pThr/pTyr-binding forkhead associated (FHA) protein
MTRIDNSPKNTYPETVFKPHDFDTTGLDMATIKSLSATAQAIRGIRSAVQKQAGQYLILFVLTRQEPVILPNKREIIIGRTDAKHGIYPTLDLTHDFARDLGVSRKHARIDYQSGLYFIQDLGSRNGTWVNESRLAPFDQYIIHSGDSIRLSHLIIQVG